MTLHVYTAPRQPATRFRIDVGGVRAHWIRQPRRRLLYCRVCGRRRWAAKLVAQVFYDDVRFFCRDGDACRR